MGNYKSCYVAMYKAFDRYYNFFNRQYPGKSKDDKKSMVLEQITKGIQTIKEDSQHHKARLLELTLFAMDMDGKIPHIYLADDRLVPYLTSTLKPGKQDKLTEVVESEILNYYYEQMSKMNPASAMVAEMNKLMNSDKSVHEQLMSLVNIEGIMVCPLHIHSGISGITGGFVLEKDGRISVEAIQDDGNGDNITINSLDAIYHEIKSGSQKHKATIDVCCYIMNTFFYTKMFADILKDEAPKGASKKNIQKNSKQMTIGVSPKISIATGTGTRTYNASGELPAYPRSETYAFLKDERYKTKRFQTIYKRATICHRKGADVKTLDSKSSLVKALNETKVVK